MGVDGIDKADIFDEYFDDDKPKLTNYEKIKAILEVRDCKPERIKCRKCKIQEICQSYKIKQWLKQEK